MVGGPLITCALIVGGVSLIDGRPLILALGGVGSLINGRALNDVCSNDRRGGRLIVPSLLGEGGFSLISEGTVNWGWGPLLREVSLGGGGVFN